MSSSNNDNLLLASLVMKQEDTGGGGEPVDPLANISGADTAWVLACTCLVFLMIPGLGFFYGGFTNSKTILSTLLSTGISLAVVSLQWYLFGYSWAFSDTGSPWAGDLRYALMRNVGSEPSSYAGTIPHNAFAMFQMMFAILGPPLAFGSALERTTMSAYAIFVFFWTTLVYDVVCYWVWSKNGWGHSLGGGGILDFAGGTPVHVVAGFSAAAYAVAVGPRRTLDLANHKPKNITFVYLGTLMLWLGWFGFNSGCALSITSRTVNAVVITNLSASFGGLTWMMCEMVFHRKRQLALFDFCCGAIAGLVGITPSAGFVSSPWAILIGFLTAIVCFFCAVNFKKWSNYKYDDVCDVLAVHGMGGFVGGLWTAIFVDNAIVTMGGDDPVDGGFFDQNYILIVWQLVGAVVAAIYAFVVTYLLVQLIGILPFTKLRLSIPEEEVGMDWIETGESTYGYDIKEFEPQVLQEIRKKQPKESGLRIFRSFFKSRAVASHDQYHSHHHTDNKTIATPPAPPPPAPVPPPTSQQQTQQQHHHHH